MNLYMRCKVVEFKPLPVEIAKPIWPDNNQFFLVHETIYMRLVEPTITRCLSA